MALFRSLTIVAFSFALCACAATRSTYDPKNDLGIMWVKHAAEYRALTTQVYRDAMDDLPAFIEDTTWSMVSVRADSSALPPAVILDVDETVVSNVNFQLTFDRPFASHKLDSWAANNQALAIPGVTLFVNTARSLGVTVFFVTNRPCETKDGVDDPCPQQQTTIDGIRELGLDVDADHVMLSGEQPDWNGEKTSRRQHIAKTHRVIMLIGDDFGDFAPCVRAKPQGSCTTAATQASRIEALKGYRDHWGNGWYILPNPMHGSWTSFE